MDQIRQCMDNKEPSRVKFRRAEPDPPLLAVRLGSARVSVRQCMAHYGSDSCPHHRKICSFRFHYCRPNVTHHSFRQGDHITLFFRFFLNTPSSSNTMTAAATFFEKTHVCNWASKIRRCMVNNQRVRLAS
ncbi:hypothetical protein J6590_063572 [Homalodisca vitripennis]|nr:hypothetical protein J6590_063572 [Homalodisca vitripennis]